MNPYFEIDKPISFVDEKITVTVKNVPVGEDIRLVATSSDFYCINAKPNVGVKSTWQAEATYAASGSDELCLDVAKAVGGDYTGIEPMGLFYAMKPVEIIAPENHFDLREIPLYDQYHITVSAYVGETLLCETTLTRQYMAQTITSENVTKNNWCGRFFYDADSINRPSIIVLSGSDGRIEKAQAIAEVLTHYGFNTLAVCYFGLKGTAESLTAIPVTHIAEAIDFLKAKTGNSQIGIYGRSKGGEYALLAASELQDITCAVANTPSHYIFEGLNPKHKPSKQPSWIAKTKTASFIPFKIHAFIPFIVKKVLFKKNDLVGPYTYLIKKYGNENNRTHVEAINGPVLLLSAKGDEIWPSSMFCDGAMTYLENHPHRHEHIAYQHAGHMLTIAYQPNPRYSKEKQQKMFLESVDSWEKTVQFFQAWGK